MIPVPVLVPDKLLCPRSCQLATTNFFVTQVKNLTEFVPGKSCRSFRSEKKVLRPEKIVTDLKSLETRFKAATNLALELAP